MLRGEIEAGIEEEVDRSSSPVDLRLKGLRGHHLGQHQRTESKARAVGGRAGRRKTNQTLETAPKSQNRVVPEASPSFQLLSPYIPFVFVLLELV